MELAQKGMKIRSRKRWRGDVEEYLKGTGGGLF